VAVIGGGNSGVEAAIDLAGIVGHVTLLEFDSKLRADAVLQAKLKSLPNVTVHVNAQTTEVIGDGQKVTAMFYKDRVGGERPAHRTGRHLRPDRPPAEHRLAQGHAGALAARRDRSRRTRPDLGAGVFAAGDATTVPYKQIIIAMGEGAKASLSAFDHLIRQSVPAPAAEAAVA
jgi:alkyl hydroperoxide reductase subunit F